MKPDKFLLGLFIQFRGNFDCEKQIELVSWDSYVKYNWIHFSSSWIL